MALTRDDISLLAGIVATEVYKSLDNFSLEVEKYITYYGLQIESFSEVVTFNVSKTREAYSTAVIGLIPLPESDAEPIIFVASRGSANLVNWSDNLDIFQAQAIFPFTDPNLPIEGSKTFIQWNSFANFDWNPEGQTGPVCEQNGIRDLLECLFQKSLFTNAPVVCCGHSSGSLVAGFHAASSAHEFINHQTILITFGSPKTGNKSYNEVISKSIVDLSGGWIRQYITPNDVVPRVSLYDVYSMDEIYAPVFTVTMANTEEIIDDFTNKTIGGVNQFLFTIGNLLKADPNFYLGIQEGLYNIKISSFTKYLTGHFACVYKEAMLRKYWPNGGNVKECEEDKFLSLCSYNNRISSANAFINEISLAYKKNMEILCDVVRNPCNNIWYNEGPDILRKMICNYKHQKKQNMKDMRKSIKLFADTLWSDDAECLEFKPAICNVLKSCNPLKQEPCKYSCCCKKNQCKKLIENANKVCEKHKKKNCEKCKKYKCNPQVPCKPCRKCEKAHKKAQEEAQPSIKNEEDKPIIESKYKQKYGRVKIV